MIRTKKCDVKIVVVFVVLVLLSVSLVVALMVNVDTGQILSVQLLTFNMTQNLDCTGVVLNKVVNVSTNSFGGAWQYLNPNDLIGIPNYVCVFNTSSLLLTENITRRDLLEELLTMPQIFSAWNNIVSNEINSTPLPVPFDVEDRQDFFYIHQTTGDMSNTSVRKKGDYLVETDVCLQVKTGNTTTHTNCWLEKNGAKIVGSQSYVLHQNEAKPYGCHHIIKGVNLNGNDRVQVACKSLGTSTFTTTSEASRITIEYKKDKPDVV